MKYTTYYVAKGNLHVVKRKIKEAADTAIIISEQNGFFPFVVLNEKQEFWKKWDWLLEILDAKDCGWGFSLYMSGREVIKVIYEKNDELCAKHSDNGYQGDIVEAAEALGVSLKKLEQCLNENSVEKLCRLIGFSHENKLDYVGEHNFNNEIVLD